MEDASRLHDVKTKIKQNKKLKDKAVELRKVLKDKNALAQCDAEINQTEKYLEYLHKELAQLDLKYMPQLANNTNTEAWQDKYGQTQTEDDDLRSKRTSLDLLKAELPINRDKVIVKLQELTQRLNEAQAVHEGMRKLAETIPRDTPDRRWMLDVEQKLADSYDKILLIKKAVRKYESLHIGSGSTAAQGEKEALTCTTSIPYPLSPAEGKLRLKIVEAKQLTHAPTRMFHDPQTFVLAKVDGRRQCRTRPSRTDSWTDCLQLEVTKTSDVELVVYDQEGERTLPIGLLWLKMADITEDMRQKKKKQQQIEVPLLDESASDTCQKISEWFDVEPIGRLYVHLTFARKKATKVKAKTGPLRRLRRVGALREQEGMIQLVSGHKFKSTRFYQLLRCSLCRNLMLSMAYQCEDCHLTCHRRCCNYVVTGCVARSALEKGDDNELKYDIPHRFELFTSLATNYCYHCGQMLPMTVKGSYRCSECTATCHVHCKPFIPNYCGITMETAYRLLNELRSANERRRSALPPHDSSDQSPSSSSDTSVWRTAEENEPSLNAATRLQMSTHLSATPVHISQSVDIDDFNFLAVLGRGNFGKVLLAESKYTRELFAVKAIKKQHVMNDVDSIMEEKRVFMITRKHPFLVHLHSAFMTRSRLFFVMEYLQGGDLMTHIQRGGRFTETQARFYSCEVILALEHLHLKGIVYRDLKLDNVLLGADGHIKLTDFGLCKHDMWHGRTTGTYCGTPESMAPEILMEQGYTRAVDWWTLGVLLYEMLTGQAPFRGETEDELYDAILRDPVVCPFNMSEQAKNICYALLEKDPKRRLGGGPDDADDVRAHPFYKGVNWSDILQKRIPPPFIPKIESREDTSNFDPEFTGEFPVFTPVQSTISDAQEAYFKDFPYISEWAFATTTTTSSGNNTLF